MLFIYFRHFLPVVEICFLCEYLLFWYMQVECLIYGNCTAKDATDLYNYVIERLKKDCNTRWWSFFVVQYHKTVLRIRDILVQIRIRGSVPLTNEFWSASYYFRRQSFLLITFEATFTSFFKDKKSPISHKTVGIKFFLLFLHRRIRSWSWIRTSY